MPPVQKSDSALDAEDIGGVGREESGCVFRCTSSRSVYLNALEDTPAAMRSAAVVHARPCATRMMINIGAIDYEGKGSHQQGCRRGQKPTCACDRVGRIRFCSALLLMIVATTRTMPNAE